MSSPVAFFHDVLQHTQSEFLLTLNGYYLEVGQVIIGVDFELCSALEVNQINLEFFIRVLEYAACNDCVKETALTASNLTGYQRMNRLTSGLPQG